MTFVRQKHLLLFLIVLPGAVNLSGCKPKQIKAEARIQITRVPQSDPAGGTKTEVIQGIASGGTTEDRVVLYAFTGSWWVQPLEKEPFTHLDRRLHWINGTHLGTSYAALLVGLGYVPPKQISQLPSVGGQVKAVTVAQGKQSPPSDYINFSGYEWRTRESLSNRGGTLNKYAAKNAWVDPTGALHLQISGTPKDWVCSEITLAQSLGYGTYSFELREVSKLEPSVVFAFFTYDYANGDENHREANIEVSRWGDSSIKNGQYVVQPYNVPNNVNRFVVPAGRTIHSMDWQPGRIKFRSLTASGKLISEHVFASGIPQAGLESPRMALYVYNTGPDKQTHPAEVVVEKFSYLP